MEDKKGSREARGKARGMATGSDVVQEVPDGLDFSKVTWRYQEMLEVDVQIHLAKEEARKTRTERWKEVRAIS